MFRRVYKSINTLPVWNFFRITETGDLRYLIKKQDYDNLGSSKNGLDKIWTNILDQFYKEDGSNVQEIYCKDLKKIHELEIKYTILYNLYFVFNFSLNPPKEAHDTLKKLNIDENKIKKALNQTKNDLQLKRKDFENSHKEGEQKTNFEQVKDHVEKYKGFYIDPHKLTVKEWINILKNIKENGNERSNKR